MLLSLWMSGPQTMSWLLNGTPCKTQTMSWLLNGTLCKTQLLNSNKLQISFASPPCSCITTVQIDWTSKQLAVWGQDNKSSKKPNDKNLVDHNSIGLALRKGVADNFSTPTENTRILKIILMKSQCETSWNEVGHKSPYGHLRFSEPLWCSTGLLASGHRIGASIQVVAGPNRETLKESYAGWSNETLQLIFKGLAWHWAQRSVFRSDAAGISRR